MSASTRLLAALGLLLILTVPAFAATIRVPADQPTIQAGIVAAARGDTVLVAQGTYTGEGNRDIEVIEKDLLVRTEAGPQGTVIDCQGRPGDPHRGLSVISSHSDIVLEGFWIRNGYVDRTVPSNAGGAVFCTGSRPPRITNCVFSGNAAEIGGAVAVAFGEGTLVADHCTFVGNAAAFGGAGVAAGIASVNLAQCIIAFSAQGCAVECAAGAGATLRCCDLYGNAGGDWTGCIAGQGGSHGNLSADPLFCDAPHGDLTLDAQSPCAPPQSGDCGLIGALPIGCGPTTAVPDAQPSTWGVIKALYR